MTSAQGGLEAQKRAAAERAVELVRPGMVVGLGTGSTAGYFIHGLGAAVRNGLRIKAVATSARTREQAQANAIPVVDDFDGRIDLAVDGADEIDPAVNCIKGRGGALLREKIVAHASRRFIVIADSTKLVDALGNGPVPIEVLPFLWQVTRRFIESLGGRPELRMGEGGPYRTDNGNLILDTKFSTIGPQLAASLETIPGVLEHGLFFGLAAGALIGQPDGIRVLGQVE
jgi:ribose 5-phosphate isomerase A